MIKFLCILLIAFAAEVFSTPEYFKEKFPENTEVSYPIDPNNIRWAIVCMYLPSGKKVLNQRNIKLANAIRPFSFKHNITMVFFSEVIPPNELKESIKSIFNGIARVSFIDTSADGNFGYKPVYGYKYMCKFFTFGIYKYLQDQYDYYLRLDSDCIIKKIHEDIFHWAEVNQVNYGYVVRKLETHGPTLETLPKFVIDYASEFHLKPKAVLDMSMESGMNFYNNFHIGNVHFFSRPDVNHFFRAVNASGGITQYRWGDSTTQAYVLRLFSEPGKIGLIPKTKYLHGSHNYIGSSFHKKGSTVDHQLPSFFFGTNYLVN